MSQLDALKAHTTVVADTGDFRQLAHYHPRDATTNPSLILKAVGKPDYAPLLKDVVKRFGGRPVDEQLDRLVVRFGCEILAIVPGRVSTEVDARLSFDTAATLARAQRLIDLYQAEGIPAERVLIKVASTWEGIRAAEQLEQRGIRTNLTLLFSFAQAVACGDAKVQLVSPFVGRIHDWFKLQAGASWDEAANAGPNDPGVQAVHRIYDYYKHFGIATEIMGASFRNTAQILALAGCDFLTISPELLAELASKEGPVPRALEPAKSASLKLHRVHYGEPAFRFALNEDVMASAKLAEGIRRFVIDAVKLEAMMQGAAA